MKRREKRFQLFRYVNVLLGAIIASALYFFLFSPYFTIRNVEVYGNEVIAADDILEIVDQELGRSKFFVLKNNNSFLFSKKAFKAAVAEHFILDDIVITKVLPDTLKITVDEKIAAMQWNSAGRKYLLGSEGIIIKEVFSSKSPYKVFQLTEETEEEQALKVMENGFINIQNRGGEQVSLGDSVITYDHIKFIQGAFEQIESSDFFTIQEVFVPHTYPQSVSFIHQDGWELMLNLNDSLAQQIERLNLLVQEKIGLDNLSKLEYIDLKLGESVYFKFK